MDKLKAVLTRREDPESANITEDDRGFISEALDASTLSYRQGYTESTNLFLEISYI